MKPESAEAVKVSYNDKTDTLVGWLDGAKFYISSQGHGKIYANMNASGMFGGYVMLQGYILQKLTQIDVTNLDTSRVFKMNGMFENCKAVKTLDLSSFDTSQVTDMEQMFDSCTGLESVDLSGWNTEKVTEMSEMFSDCEALKTVDISSFTIDQEPNMYSMFSGCTSLEKVYISDSDSWENIDKSELFGSDSKAELTVKKTA